ncbi:MAG: hypothetical protein H6648_09825 [Caldilineae bacterium]|nr:hypothetical protein [Chloroflexota bacterium]MCB9177447.1 hypothetical protein [Caldilineae bacterium]
MRRQTIAVHHRAFLGLLLAGWIGLRLAGAAPAQEAQGRCAWERLSAGEASAQLSLVGLPELGVLAFGGADDPRSETVTDTLRLLDQRASSRGSWRQLAPLGRGPGPRAQHSSILRDAADGTTMLTYGGVDTLPPGGTFTWQSPLGGGGVLPQTFGRVYDSAFGLRLDGATPRWEAIEDPASGPRADHSAVYDPAADAMIVFGGRSGEADDSRTADLRRLRLGPTPAWEPLALEGGPDARFAHSAVYDPVGRRMLVYGGTRDWTQGLDELWSLELDAGWEAARWRRLAPAGSPPLARFDHGAVYLPEQGWMLIFGGSSDGLGALNDLAALDLASEPPRWLTPAVSGPLPPSLRGMGAAWSPIAGQAVFLGGQAEGAIERLAWGLRCLAPGAATWTPTATATRPAASPTPGSRLHLPRVDRP